MRGILVSLAALTLAGLSLGQAPTAGPKIDTSRGDALRDAYFRKQVEVISGQQLAGVKSKEDWESRKPELRRQLLEMFGLWPLPARTDMKPTVTGTIDLDDVVVEKLHFQSMPGLYVTGNLYRPKKVTDKLPAVLYVCGHATSKAPDGSPTGSKVPYQRHPLWFARNGYVSLVIDTLQLGEIEGIHHGLYTYGMWWWQTLGYTPAGIETWNGMRALDYLASRPEVDGKRLGVTGRSGGGATSWWLAAVDERVQCAVPVAGLSDLKGHVVESQGARKTGAIEGHCDCMYFVNTYRWDFETLISLCAPRPVLLGNSDDDDIFPVAGYRRPAEKAKAIYALYGAGDKFQLMETKGKHVDTPELRRGAFEWFNRHLKKETKAIDDPDTKPIAPQELKVFDKIPADATNKIIHELFRRPARPELPEVPAVAKQWWPAQRELWLKELKEKCFRGWPGKPADLAVKPVEEIVADGVRLRAWDFTSEEEVPLRVWVMTAEKVTKPTLLVLDVLDEPAWEKWCAGLGPKFQKSLGALSEVPRDDKMFEQNRSVMEKFKWGFAAIAPRGIGPTRWNETGPGGKPTPHILRRFGLLGQTLDGQRVWDVRRAVAALGTVENLKGVDRWLQGKGPAAGIALYAGLFEPEVKRFDLWYPSPSHAEGPTFLNVRTILDMPQAVALAASRKVMLYVEKEADKTAWAWPAGLEERLEAKFLQLRVVGK
jgi:hypothetical protein